MCCCDLLLIDFPRPSCFQDARTGEACWTSHRPLRGWYLTLTSPALPPGLSISLKPLKLPESSATTPLTFSVRSSVALQVAISLRSSIEEAAEAQIRFVKETREKDVARRTVEASTAPIIQVSSHDPEDLNPGHGRTSSRSAHPVGGAGSIERHARRRSAGGPHSPPMTTSSRNVSGASTLRNFSGSSEGGNARVLLHAGTPVGGESSSRAMGLPRIDTSISNSSKSSSVSPMSTGGASSFDRPYSPTESRPRLPQISPSSPTSPGRSTGRGRSGDSEAPLRESRTCTFVIADDVGGAPSVRAFHAKSRPQQQQGSQSQSTGSTLTPQTKQGHSRLSWARYIWTLVPSPIRPQLSYDTSKAFRIVWTDAPRLMSADAPMSPQSDTGESATRQVEILRFEDTSGWWFWQPSTSGRIVLHEEAVRAIGIDRRLWFAVALSYLGFLDERDGYFAAHQGS